MSQFTALDGHQAGLDPAHDDSRRRLADYAMSQLAGTADDPVWRDLVAHLATCPACRAEADDLIEVLAATALGTLPAAPSYPAPDLSFLGAPTLVAIERAASVVGRLVIEFSAALVAAARQPGLAGAYRGPGAWLYEHATDHPDALQVAIDVTPVGADSQRVRVRVKVVDPRVSPLEQEGHRITLEAPSHTDSGVTDHHGNVAFGPLPVADVASLRFTIEARSPA